MRNRAAAVLILIGILLATTAATTMATATARTYDRLVVTDPKGDVRFNGQSSPFPDLTSATYEHLVSGSTRTFLARIQLRKDKPWRRLDLVEFNANNVHVLISNSGGSSATLHLFLYRGDTKVSNKGCTLVVNKTARSVRVGIPWKKLGSPSNLKLSKAYAEHGEFRDVIKAPSRALY